MIISCICGKYEFEVSQNDIPKKGRNVQCGICNETWFQTPYEKKGKLSSTKNSTAFISFSPLAFFTAFIDVLKKLFVKTPGISIGY